MAESTLQEIFSPQIFMKFRLPIIFTETRYLLNHHKMMAGRDYAYDGVLGGKTGYTDAAGATLITYAKRGNMTLVAVVMNSVNGAWADTKVSWITVSTIYE